jgi:hypothetical protein
MEEEDTLQKQAGGETVSIETRKKWLKEKVEEKEAKLTLMKVGKAQNTTQHKRNSKSASNLAHE